VPTIGRAIARCATLTAGLFAAATAGGQTLPGDAYAADPVGIIADPCPPHPTPRTDAEWQARQRHMFTRDFGQLCRYAAENRMLRERPRVVFMGDSITEGWIGADPSLFTDGLVDRGIGGQTTPQMLVRFRQDVLALKPRAVHIMAGTNDLAGNTGAATFETVQGHIASMAELARAHGIKVILASIPPAIRFPWAPDKRPAPQIARLNAWVRSYAHANGFTYVDYHAAMALADGGMRPGLASDGVHPTPQGYAVMRPLALAAIAQALGR
jgi:lysophospholipase L1-like esterase